MNQGVLFGGADRSSEPPEERDSTRPSWAGSPRPLSPRGGDLAFEDFELDDIEEIESKVFAC